MKKFLKVADVSLMNGGYLCTGNSEPVYNKEFYTAQKAAEYVVEFAKVCSTMNFKTEKASTLQDAKNQVLNNIANKNKLTFLELPAINESPITDKLKEEALSFINNTDKRNQFSQINKYMLTFAAIKEFEDFGLFFEGEICKLDKIYTIKDILSAVVEAADHIL